MMTRCRNAALSLSTVAGLLLLAAGCGLFEPRTPEDPSQSSLNQRPPTDPSIVLANLQSAIDQKIVENYVGCLSNSAAGGRAFTFQPSADARSAYASVFSSWTRTDEQDYMQNLIAKCTPTSFSNLQLAVKDSLVTADSVVYTCSYTLEFDHTDPTFPTSAQGDLQFALAPDQSHFWSIFRWVDFKTSDAITWSQFKGKFSN